MSDVEQPSAIDSEVEHLHALSEDIDNPFKDFEYPVKTDYQIVDLLHAYNITLGGNIIAMHGETIIHFSDRQNGDAIYISAQPEENINDAFQSKLLKIIVTLKKADGSSNIATIGPRGMDIDGNIFQLPDIQSFQRDESILAGNIITLEGLNLMDTLRIPTDMKDEFQKYGDLGYVIRQDSAARRRPVSVINPNGEVIGKFNTNNSSNWPVKLLASMVQDEHREYFSGLAAEKEQEKPPEFPNFKYSVEIDETMLSRMGERGIHLEGEHIIYHGRAVAEFDENTENLIIKDNLASDISGKDVFIQINNKDGTSNMVIITDRFILLDSELYKQLPAIELQEEGKKVGITSVITVEGNGTFYKENQFIPENLADDFKYFSELGYYLKEGGSRSNDVLIMSPDARQIGQVMTFINENWADDVLSIIEKHNHRR